MDNRLSRAALAALCTLALPAAARAQGAARVDLVVAATTDVHGRLRGWDYDANAEDPRRGLARAATVVDSLRAAHPGRVVLLDAGDLLQGNAMTYVAARQPADTLHPVVAAMNAMRYDAAAIGNHEFNYGLPVLMRAVRQGRFPFLAANAYTVEGRRAFPAWRMVDRQGVNVAIVGATTPGSMVWDRDYLKGRIVVRDVVPEVRKAVEEARAARADVVLVTIHSGFAGPSSYDTVTTGVPSENVAARIAHEVPGVDLIVVGHSHGEVADTTVNGVLMMQPKNWATSVAVAHLDVQRPAGGKWQVAARRGGLVQAQGHPEAPAVVDAVARHHDAAVRYVTTPIGRTTVAWRGDSARVADVPLHDFMLEVMRRRSGAQLAAGAAFSTEAGFPAGDITVRELSRLYPYENTLRAVRVTGKQLRDFLEHSARYYRQYRPGDTASIVDPRVPGYNFDIVQGVDYTLDVSMPVGMRVTRLEYQGKPVAPTDTFTMAVNNYRQTGGGGFAMLAGAPVTYDGGSTEIRQMLIEEIQKKGTVSPDEYHRPNWRIEPAAAVARMYQAPRRPQVPSTLPPRTPTVAPATVSTTIGAPRPGERRLRVIGINDFHGALEARPDGRGVRLGGVGSLATAIRRAGDECRPGCEVILLDGGDEFQGTPASNLAFGRPVVQLYNALDVAGGALGNHEFDWGQDTLRARMREARYRIMGANVKNADGSDLGWVPDDTLVRRGPLAIGVVGISTVETPRTTKASNVTGLKFVDPVPEIEARARALRARGANVVIVVAHEGGSCDRPASAGEAASCRGPILDVAARLQGTVDAIVSGHSHTPIATIVGRVPVTQARSSGRAIGVFDLVIGDGGVRAMAMPELRDVGTDTLPADPAVDAIAQRALAALGPRVNEVIGTVAADLRRQGNQYPLGNFIADAQRFAGKADVAVMNNGGIRSDLRAGPATFGTIFEIQPFGNVLYRATVRGGALRAYLERLVRRNQPNAHVSGVRVTFDSTAAEGRRIREVLVGGTALRDDATYTLVLTDFLLTGGDGLGIQQDALKVEPLNIVDIDAFIAYVRAQPGRVISGPAERRLVPVAP